MSSYFITTQPNGGTREVQADDLTIALNRLEAVVANGGTTADTQAYGRIARIASPIGALRVGQTLTIERIA